MATLENINHDSGGAVGDHWDSVSDGGGRLSVTVGSALNGTVEGLQIDYDLSNSEVDQAFATPVSQMALTFCFDPNSAQTPSSNDRSLIGIGLSQGFSFNSKVADLIIRKRINGDIQVTMNFGEDFGSSTLGTFLISDAEHKFEIHVTRAASDVSNDGIVRFYVDSILKGEDLTLDNYDLFPTIDAIFAKFTSLEAAMSSTTFYLDEILLEDVIPIATNAFRFLGFAADNENLYASGLKDAATLQLFDYDLPTLTEAGTASFGSGTDGELDALTRGIFPVIKPMADQVLYLRGRDGNNVQVQYNDQNGTLGWVDIGPGTATWAADKYAAGLLTAPTYTDDVIAVFSDDDVYRTRFGTVTWVKMGDAGGGLRAAARHPNRFNEIMAGGTTAGTVKWSNNFGATFGDVSGTALGTINSFEVSL